MFPVTRPGNNLVPMVRPKPPLPLPTPQRTDAMMATVLTVFQWRQQYRYKGYCQVQSESRTKMKMTSLVAVKHPDRLTVQPQLQSCPQLALQAKTAWLLYHSSRDLTRIQSEARPLLIPNTLRACQARLAILWWTGNSHGETRPVVDLLTEKLV